MLPISSELGFRVGVHVILSEHMEGSHKEHMKGTYLKIVFWKLLTNRRPYWVNPLAPGRFQRNFRKVICQLILVIDGWSISCKIVLKWMPMDLADGKSTLVQVMAWCRQAPSHYLSQCWPRFLSPYGVNRPPWVKSPLPLPLALSLAG